MRRRRFTRQAERSGATRPRRQRSGRIATSPRVLLAIAILSLATAAGIALAASPQNAPTITSQPPALTNQTSASFTYTSPQAGATFECQLDSAGYTPCPASGVTYPGPLADGPHTFKVTATAKGKTSAATSYTWTIDSTAPTTTLSFPASGGVYAAGGWSSGCSTPGLCGGARDPHGVKAVLVSIRQGSGNWWGGSSFNQTSETFNAATVSVAGEKITTWSYPMSLPPQGSYTVHVRASDEVGNTTAAAGQLSSSFTVDTTPPPAPTFTSGPGSTTEAKEATFEFTDSESGVSFLCARDSQEFKACTSPRTLTDLTLGAHTFSVKTRDIAGNVSGATTYSWTVVKAENHTPFTISGNLSSPLAPGVTRSLQLTVTNPNNQQIFVTSLVVSIQAGSTKAGCDGPTNLQVTQSNVSGTNTLSVPANGQATIPAGSVSAPQVLMKNLASNQDACKGATFTFNYTGGAHS
jgi:hypothetical protein